MKYEELLALNSISSFSQTEQIDVLGSLLDLSYDNSNLKGIEHAFSLSNQIDFENLSSENKIVFHYDLANGYSYILKLKYPTEKTSWEFQLPEITKQVFHLRKAISIEGFDKIIPERRCQIYTNLANTFSHIGRLVEAQEYWNKAINIIPHFPMANANKGQGYFFYGQYLFDKNQETIFKLFALHYLDKGLQMEKYLDAGAKEFFEPMYNHLKSIIVEKYHFIKPNLNNFKLGRNKKLKQYREWCLENVLYINPLNDIGNYTDAAHDCLNLSNLIFEQDSPPTYFTLFNQIKQEFGAARYMLFESIQQNEAHFSDIDIVILETSETARYSYYVELLKNSFKNSYSILDKIAYLLNDYLKLGIPEHEVSFRTLWYEKKRKGELREFFQKSENLILRGLFWLSKDLFEKEEDFDSVLEPEAKEIATIRNYIEHKAFKVVSDILPYPPYFDQEKDIAYVISRMELEIKAIKLLKLARAAIIYLSLAIDREESKKDYTDLKKINIELNAVPHEHKR